MTRSVAGLGAFEAATVAVRAASTSAPAGLELVFELELKFARLVDLNSEIGRAGFVSNFFWMALNHFFNLFFRFHFSLVRSFSVFQFV